MEAGGGSNTHKGFLQCLQAVLLYNGESSLCFGKFKYDTINLFNVALVKFSCNVMKCGNKLGFT